MGYQVNYGNQAFVVPGAVADHFLRLANETQLRVLLYLLRHAETEISPAQAAAFLRIDEELAEEAFIFWMQANVLTGDVPQLSVPVMPAVPEAVPAPEKVPAATVQRSSREVKLDPSEIAAMLDASQELKDLFALSEKMMGRPLNHMEQRSLLWLHSYLNIRSEVILTLLGYCISIGKYSISYAEAIAIRWEHEGIVTLELAEAEIQRLKKEYTYTEQLCKMFEMKRRPTPKQKEFMDAWQQAGYPMELLQLAYEITVENIEKLNFKYMNTILADWAGQGITSAEQAKQLRAAPKSATSRRKKQDAPLTEKEVEEMNAYLSLVNNFEEDDT